MSNTIKENNTQINGVLLSNSEKILLAIFFIHLPFVYSLTINVGFPLKISEVSLFFIFLFFLIYKRIISLFSDKSIRLFSILSGVFLLILTVSTIINSFWQYDYPLNLQFFRKNIILTSFLKLGYTCLAVFSAFVVYYALKAKKDYFITCILIGSAIASLYCWYLFWFSLLKIHYYTLPGSDQFPQAALFKFGHFIRCGTFKEGNHMGLFLLVSGIISMYHKKKILGYFFLITTLTTASSMAIATSLLFIGGVFIQDWIRKKQYLLIVASLIFVSVSLVVLYLISPDAQYIVSKVIPGQDSYNRDAIFSQQERINLAISSLEMSFENPFWGIGLTQFSAHYEHFSGGLFPQTNEKMLSNNIYLEILAEAGWAALLTFLGMLFYIAKSLLNSILKWGYLSMLIYWLAYPTFTVLFLWVFIGILLYDISENRKINTFKLS